MIFYLPVANIQTLANPFAHRFMYLPSIGFLGGLIIIAQRFYQQWEEKSYNRLALRTFVLSITVICILMTPPLNSFWENNFTYARFLVKTYPRHYPSCELYASLYFQADLCPQATNILGRCLELGPPTAKARHIYEACNTANQ
jgi:hypothetical protein